MNKEFHGLFQENINIVCSWHSGKLYFDTSKMSWIQTTEILDLEGFYTALMDQIHKVDIKGFLTWLNKYFLPMLSVPETTLPSSMTNGHTILWFKRNRIECLVIDSVIYLQLADVKNACKIRTLNPERGNSDFFQSTAHSFRGHNQWYVRADYLRRMISYVREIETSLNLICLLEGLPYNKPLILSFDEIEMYCSIAKELAIHREDLVRKWWKVVNRPALSLNP